MRITVLGADGRTSEFRASFADSPAYLEQLKAQMDPGDRVFIGNECVYTHGDLLAEGDEHMFEHGEGSEIEQNEDEYADVDLHDLDGADLRRRGRAAMAQRLAGMAPRTRPRTLDPDLRRLDDAAQIAHRAVAEAIEAKLLVLEQLSKFSNTVFAGSERAFKRAAIEAATAPDPSDGVRQLGASQARALAGQIIVDLADAFGGKS